MTFFLILSTLCKHIKCNSIIGLQLTSLKQIPRSYQNSFILWWMVPRYRTVVYINSNKEEIEKSEQYF